MLKQLQTLLAQILPKKYDSPIPAPVDSSHSGVGISSQELTPLEKCLVNNEGLKHYVYLDTLGNFTIGVGRNISPSGPGLSTQECMSMLHNDILQCISDLSKYDWYLSQDSVRQGALIELRFAMGMAGLLTFKNLIQSMESKNYRDAAEDLITSKWAKQVGENRTTNICNRLRTGTY